MIDPNKQTLSIQEASELTTYSVKSLYKLIASRKIGAFKPTGGKMFIDRKELEAFVRTNRIHSNDELTNMAVRHNQLRKQA